MSHAQRLNALKSVYDSNPSGNLSNYIVLNFGKNISGYSGKHQYYANNGCASFRMCTHSQDMVIYLFRTKFII